MMKQTIRNKHDLDTALIRLKAKAAVQEDELHGELMKFSEWLHPSGMIKNAFSRILSSRTDTSNIVINGVLFIIDFLAARVLLKKSSVVTQTAVASALQAITSMFLPKDLGSIFQRFKNIFKNSDEDDTEENVVKDASAAFVSDPTEETQK